ncbi:MAG TPA: ABC transporter permease [Vicinamibacteria bacterium]|nr:ABC transporter permease [Vicinamibacteria bacterium]
MQGILSDVRLAARSWAKRPGFTLIAVASIALGIGANTAIFTLVDQVLLRPLPVPNPQELVQVSFNGMRYGSNWGDGSEVSYPTYAEIRDNNEVFSGMFCRFAYDIHVGDGSRTERVSAELVSGTYFPVLGVGAALGRTLAPEDDRTPGGHPVVVLSHAYWSSRFASDPAVLGRSLVVNGRSYTVVGVAERGFGGIELGRAAQVFLPVMMKAEITPGWSGLDERLMRWVRVFGRLRPGLTREAAAAAVQPLFRTGLEADLADPEFRTAPDELRKRYLENRIAITPGGQGRSRFRQELSGPLWVLMGTAVGVLLIACANVANLLLARGAARQREMALRHALGASRSRLVRQLLVESVLLALAGGLAGVLLAAVGAPMVLRLFASRDAPLPVSTLPDLRILGFTFAVSTLTGILFGLTPALRSSRPDLAQTLKDQATSVAGGQARLRKALVASQVAVSLLLLIAAGLFLRTLDNLLAENVGFDTQRLVSFSVDPSLNGNSPRHTKELSKALLERLTAAPGVAAASLASTRLLDGNQWTSDFTVAGYRHGESEDMEQNCNTVSPGYFRAMGISILAGREFDERDQRHEEMPDDQLERQFRVAVVNERFARKYFAGRDPVGQRIGFGTNPGQAMPIEIVGVAADSKYTGVRDETQRQVFFPFLESARPRGFTVYVRANQSPEPMFDAVRRIVHELDANLPVAATRTLCQQVEKSVRQERMVATMSAIFGGLATLLAVVGLYGVMAYSVARRTREIGIRMALGARMADIAWMVVREALTISAAGIVLALLSAFWLGRLVASQLYGVTVTDPLTVASAVGLLAFVSLLAGLVPSRRAARVEPTAALRYE